MQTLKCMCSLKLHHPNISISTYQSRCVCVRERDLFLCFHWWAPPRRVASSCARFCCRTEKKSSHRSHTDAASHLGRHAHKHKANFLLLNCCRVPSTRRFILYFICSALITKKCTAAQLQTCPTHQNVRACVFVDLNTLQRIAHNHLPRTEMASLLKAATHHKYTYCLPLHYKDPIKLLFLQKVSDVNVFKGMSWMAQHAENYNRLD